MGKLGPSQPNEKCKLESPTTEGLYVTLQAYLIELVCLNMSPKLGPRFWRDQYWSAKFKRESRATKSFIDEAIKTNDPLYQKAIFVAIKQLACKSLMRQTTRQRLIKRANRIYAQLIQQRQNMVANAPKVCTTEGYMERNAKIVQPEIDTKLDRMRDIENG